MTLDKFETDLLGEARKNNVPSLEVSKPVIGERLINICRGLAQRAFAFPKGQKTIDQAWRDENFINENSDLIELYTSYIDDGNNSNVNNLFGTEDLVDHFAKNIAVKDAEIIEVKTTPLTKEQVTDKDRFKIKFTPGGLLKI